jgi:NAD(P)-dependent dehydrogenase (short-subunit alcohol dehydrogenase family)
MITGAASGIGRETAITLAKLGAAGLAISDVNTKGLQETQEECNISCWHVSESPK